MEHHNKTTKSETHPLNPQTIQNKAIALQDNRPSSVLQRKANNAAPIQRRVEEFRGKDKILYYSTYKRAVEPDDLKLYHTREEAERIDEEYHQIWQRMQAVNEGSATSLGGAKASASGVSSTMNSSHSTSSKQEKPPVHQVQ